MMKNTTPQEVLKTFGITEKTRYHDYNYLWRSILKAMEVYASKHPGDRAAQSPFNGVSPLCSGEDNAG